MYLIFVLINLFAFPPISRTKYANDFLAIGKSHSEYVLGVPAETIVPLLSQAVRLVYGDYTLGVSESELCLGKRYPVFFLVFTILFGIPL